MILSATELGILDNERDALIETLALLERGMLRHVSGEALDNMRETTETHYRPPYEKKWGKMFNMNFWADEFEDCGTVACIGGTAETVGQMRFDEKSRMHLSPLFFPDSGRWNYEEITISEAAKALRGFLETGDPDQWSQMDQEVTDD